MRFRWLTALSSELKYIQLISGISDLQEKYRQQYNDDSWIVFQKLIKTNLLLTAAPTWNTEARESAWEKWKMQRINIMTKFGIYL